MREKVGKIRKCQEKCKVQSRCRNWLRMCTENEKWKIMDHFTSHTNQRELQLGRGKNESCGHVCIVGEERKVDRVRRANKMKEK